MEKDLKSSYLVRPSDGKINTMKIRNM